MAELDLHDSGSKKDSKKDASATPQKEAAMRFRTDALVHGSSTGLETDSRNKRTNEKVKSEFSEFSKDTHDQLSRFVRGHVRDLYENVYKGTNPDLLKDPKFQLESKLLEYFISDQGELLVGEDKNGLPDAGTTDRVNEFFKTPRGYAVAEQLMEDSMAIKSMQLGMYHTSSNPGERSTLPEPTHIKTGEDQGVGNRFIQEKIVPNRDKILGYTSGILGSTGLSGLGYLHGGIGEAIAGAAAIPLTKLAIVVGQSIKNEGQTIDTRRSGAMMQALQNDPQRAEYIKRMYKVDVNDFTVNPVLDTIKPKDGRTMESTGMKRLQSEVNQALLTRKQYLQELGIPKDVINRSPESFLFNADSGFSPEDIGTRMQSRIYEAFDTKNNLRDENGKKRGEPGFGVGVGMDNAGNYSRYMDARRQVLVGIVAEMVNNIESPASEKPQAVITTLGNKITARERTGEGDAAVDGPILAEKTKATREKIANLEKDKLTQQGALGTFETLNQRENELKTLISQLNEEGLTLDVSASFDEVLKEAKDQGDKLTYELTDAAFNGGTSLVDTLSQLKAKIRDERIDAYNAALKRAEAGLKGTVDNAAKAIMLKEASEGVDDKYKAILEAATKEVTSRETQKKAIETLRDQYRDLAKERNKEADKVLIGAPKELVSMTQSYDKLISPIGFTATITPDILNNRSVDEIIALATDASTYGIANSTPEEQAALRKLVIEAITEQKAREEEKYIKTSPEAATAYQEIALNTGVLFSPDDLLSKSETEILHTLGTDVAYASLRTRLAASGGDIRNELALAKGEARKKLSLRYRLSLGEKTNDIDKQIEQLNNRIKNESLQPEIDQLTITKALLDRQPEVFSEAGKVVKSRENNKFTKIDKVQPTDTTYTEAEKAIPAEKGYYEIVDLLFAYKEKDDKDDYFKKIYAILPPEKLAELMDAGLELGATNPRDLTEVLTTTQDRIKNHTLNKRHIRKALEGVMDRLRDEALALP